MVIDQVVHFRHILILLLITLFAQHNYVLANKEQEMVDTITAQAEAGDSRAQAWIGSWYKRLGALDRAEDYLKKAASQGHAEGMYELACLYEKQAKNAEAEFYYKSASKQGNSKAQSRFAAICFLKGDLSQAEHYYKKILARGSYHVALALATIAEQQGHLKEAERYYQLAQSKGFSSNNYWEAQLYQSLANLYEKEGLHEASKRYAAMADQRRGYLLRFLNACGLKMFSITSVLTGITLVIAYKLSNSHVSFYQVPAAQAA